MTANTSTTQSRAKETSREVLSDWENIKEKALETTEALSRAAHHIRENMGEAFHDSVDSIKDKSSDLHENIVKYVKANPVKSIGWAALSGIILAHLLRK